MKYLLIVCTLLLLGGGSDAFFSNMFDNMFGGRGLFGGNNFWGFGGQAREECSRTCNDIMDDASSKETF